MRLRLLSDPFAIIQMPLDEPFPPTWIDRADVFFLAKTHDERSVICPQKVVPSGITRHLYWRCFRVEGELPFDAVGVVAQITAPLKEAGLSVFAFSTHDRDYVLVHRDSLYAAIKAYAQHGIIIMTE